MSSLGLRSETIRHAALVLSTSFRPSIATPIVPVSRNRDSKLVLSNVNPSLDKVARTAHVHLHVLEQLSDAELETFSATGAWPERLAGVGLLPGPTE